MTSDVIHIERAGQVGLIAIDNPPVNAASAAVRAGLAAAIRALAADPGVRAIAIHGAGRSFIAGADIREFGKPPADPWLPELCQMVEDCATPVVAVMHGAALGGGLEVAIAAHARVAIEGAGLGFPEVTLGILPGAGGTQRAPRLIGVAAALDLIVTGRRIGAAEALALGLVDRVAQGDPREVALAAAQEVLAGTLPTRRTGALTVAPDDAAVTAAAERLTRSQPHLFAPHRCVEAVAASTLPLAEGLARERALFQRCLDSPQRAGLIHAFLAERAVTKIPEAGTPPRPVARTGVVGGGTMGSGIATALLLAGLPVTLVERDAEAGDRARAAIAANLEGAVKRGKMTAAARDAALVDALTVAEDIAALAGADLIVEAAFEDPAAKREIFAALDLVAKPGAVLATNTSYLDIDAISGATTRPADVLGLHFFAPAQAMKLVEVVPGRATAPDAVTTGFALAKRLGKVAVRAGNATGFIGNRMLGAWRTAAEAMVLAGAAPAEVDAAVEAWGFAMGPFRVSDLAGLDIARAARDRRRAAGLAVHPATAIPDALCAAGLLGRKTGAGYYLHAEGEATPNPEALRLIEAARGRSGIAPRRFGAAEIVERYLTAMIAEGARVLDDGIALRAIDIDAVMLFGYGFPRHKGGPMHQADAIGAAALVARIAGWAAEDPDLWSVPPLLARMAVAGGGFADSDAG
jgi:3-hydroxyacyl-CoA dehydrogenase